MVRRNISQLPFRNRGADNEALCHLGPMMVCRFSKITSGYEGDDGAWVPGFDKGVTPLNWLPLAGQMPTLLPSKAKPPKH